MAALKSVLLELFLVLVSLLALTEPIISEVNLSEFPKDFYFGSATAAYQVEGAANERGRGPSLWDTFTHDQPERIVDGSNGDVAVDFYNRYREDLEGMKAMGLDAIRFSISWSRLVPNGKLWTGVNEEGIDFYNNLINEALAIGLEPFVTIFHWDTPQALEDNYGGFLNHSIVADFQDYAELCFQRFGDRVQYWITINEPLSYASNGYDVGQDAPGRCSPWVNRKCKAGDSATEPYIVSHHLLLSHAAAVKVYKDKYKASQKGKIGMALCTWWMEPFSNKKSDHDAAKRLVDFWFGWYMNPVTYGKYPDSMREYVKERLPVFSEEESAMLKGSIDFLGLNYYTARYAANIDAFDPLHLSFSKDTRVDLSVINSEGKSIGPVGGADWLRIAPFGIRYLLNYTKGHYDDPVIYITENGVATDESELKEKQIHDQVRIDYYNDHLENVLTAMKDYKVNVKGFFAWSFLDNFEWSYGYTKRFGLVYIDYNKNLSRVAKDSYRWFTNLLRKRSTTGASGPMHLPL